MTDLLTLIARLEQLEAILPREPWSADLCFDAKNGNECWCGVVEPDVIPYGSVSLTEANFIAESRNALPRLLRSLRLAIEWLEADTAHYTFTGRMPGDGTIDKAHNAREAFRAEVEGKK